MHTGLRLPSPFILHTRYASGIPLTTPDPSEFIKSDEITAFIDTTAHN